MDTQSNVSVVNKKVAYTCNFSTFQVFLTLEGEKGGIPPMCVAPVHAELVCKNYRIEMSVWIEIVMP